MRGYTVDYRKQDGTRKGTPVNRGFWLRGVPRLIPLCRLFGHKPVVDGVDSKYSGKRSLWVVCDRCGIRTDPQGPIDPDLVIGQPYRGQLPGSFPAKPTGTLGGQLVLGRTFGRGSVEFKMGNTGSEQVLAAHVALNPIGALYLHSEDHGQWLQRRLNPVGYNSREIGISVHDGRLYWKLWAKRDEWSRDDPKWQQGSFPVNLRDIVLGPLRYSYEDVGDEVTATVRMPHGDDHEVSLQLQRRFRGRKRGRRKQDAWTVDWESRKGIPVRFDDGWKGGNIYGSSVDVSAAAVEHGSWPFAAVAAIADQMMRDRVRYSFEPGGEAA